MRAESDYFLELFGFLIDDGALVPEQKHRFVDSELIVQCLYLLTVDLELKDDHVRVALTEYLAEALLDLLNFIGRIEHKVHRRLVVHARVEGVIQHFVRWVVPRHTLLHRQFLTAAHGWKVVLPEANLRLNWTHHHYPEIRHHVFGGIDNLYGAHAFSECLVIKGSVQVVGGVIWFE